MDQKVTVIYEDADLVALAKPAGLTMHATFAHKAVEEHTLADWIVEHYPETKTVGDVPSIRPGMVHRLDRDTSGVVLVARTPSAFSYLKNLFQQRDVQKTYLALVAGRMIADEGVIEKPIGLTPGTVRRTTHRLGQAKMVKEALTNYRVVERFSTPIGDCTLVEAYPKSGVTHQIRVHLASIGHPVIGDQLYGVGIQRPFARLFSLTRQFLHASAIFFTAPSGVRLNLSCQLPPDLAQVLAQVRHGRGDSR